MSWSFSGTVDASHLTVFPNGLRLYRSETGEEAPEQRLECKAVIRLRVPAGGAVRRVREVTSLNVILGEGARASTERTFRVTSAEPRTDRRTFQGLAEELGTGFDAELVLAEANFCRGEVELVIEHALSVSAEAGTTGAAFELEAASVDLGLENVACP